MTFSRGLGLKYPDPHPLELASAPLPGGLDYRTLAYNYTDMMGQIEDQGQTGNCWIFSVSGMFEAYHHRRLGTPLTVSKRACWYLAKTAYEASDLADDGGYPSDTIRTYQDIGYVLETDWPDENTDASQRIAVPTDLIRKDFLAKGLVSVGTSIEGVILAGHAHGPVAICVSWPGAWYTDAPLDANGILVPLSGPQSIGGHAILMVGHAPANALFAGCPSVTLIRNSWGPWAGGPHAPAGYAWCADDDLAQILIDGNVGMEI